MWFDSHCHLNLPGFDVEVTQLWADAVAKGVTRVFVPGTDPQEWVNSVVPTLPGVVTGVGLHPYTLRHWDEEPSQTASHRFEDAMRALEAAATSGSHVAIGECGWDKPMARRHRQWSLERQNEVVEAHLRLAVDTQLPVVLHIVQAHGLALETLRRYKLPRGGIVHCFSGNAELVPVYCRMGLSLGYGTALLRKEPRKALAALLVTPNEHLLLETDAPFAVPPAGDVPNSPSALLDVARVASQALGWDEANLAELTSRNAARVFGLEP